MLDYTGKQVNYISSALSYIMCLLQHHQSCFLCRMAHGFDRQIVVMNIPFSKLDLMKLSYILHQSARDLTRPISPKR